MLSLSEAKRLMDVEGEMPANRQDNSPHTSIEHRGNSNGQLVARISAYATAHDQAAWVEAIKAFGIRRGCERILILGNHEVGVLTAKQITDRLAAQGLKTTRLIGDWDGADFDQYKSKEMIFFASPV